MKQTLISLCVLLLTVSPVYAKQGLSATHKTLFVGSSFVLTLKNGKISKAKASKGIVSLQKVSKSRYRIKAKKAGKTTVTFKSKKQSYKCKVTINNYVSMKVVGIHQTFFNKKVIFKKGDTAYDVLLKTKLSYKKKGFGPFIYVSSINGLAEKKHGPLSGWMYSVNGKAPNVGANAYKLKAKQSVKWYYVNY